MFVEKALLDAVCLLGVTTEQALNVKAHADIDQPEQVCGCRI
jgi:hypothetical protein